MSAARRQLPRGFSLIELMVASALVLVVFAAATYAVVNLHKRGASEEGLADLQDVARGTRELVAPRIERAGAGLSNLMVNVNDNNPNPDFRTSFTVRSGAVVPPLVAYAPMVSDTVELFWADASSTMIGTPPCAGPIATSPRNGSNICVRRLPTGPSQINAATDLVWAVNPNANVGMACLFQLGTILGTPGLPGTLSIIPSALADGAAVAGNPCRDATSTFWTLSDLYLVKAGGATFSIDWTGPNQVPRLMYDADGPINNVATPVSVADNVERMQVRVGLISQALVNPISTVTPPLPAKVIWFPDATARPPRPPIDQCTLGNPACVIGPVVGMNADPNFPDATDATDARIATLMGFGATLDQKLVAQLMRRARIIELDLTVRSARFDPALVQSAGATYVMDGTGNPWDAASVGNPLDGRSRRHFVMRVSLRNYGYAGS